MSPYDPATAAGATRARPRDDRAVIVQALEDRALFAVSLGDDGWTVFKPARDTRVVYYSTSDGDDSNSGLSPGKPVATLARAQSLIRHGSADWLLLKRGDTFGAITDWRRSGRSAKEPLVISAYGKGERPQINSGTSPGFLTLSHQGRPLDNLVIRGLSFFADAYDHFNGDATTAGMRFTSPGTNLLIEDCRVAGYKDNIVLDPSRGTLSNVTVRRNVILDAHASAKVGHAQGIFIGPKTDYTTIEQNVLDHNGWRRGVDSDRTVFNHNVYSYNGAGHVVVRDNVIAEASFYGVKLNSGGTVSGNFFVRNSESIYLEDSAMVENNVITESVDLPWTDWAVGINTQKTRTATISRNLITNSLSGSRGPKGGIVLFGNGTPFSGLIERNVVYNWPTGLSVQTRGNGTRSVVIRDNQFQQTAGQVAVDHMSKAPPGTFKYEDNLYSAQDRPANRIGGTRRSLSEWERSINESGARYGRAAYPDPGRSVAQFQRFFGGKRKGFAGFVESIRGQSSRRWNEDLTAASITAWYRGGFGKALFSGAAGPGVRGFSTKLDGSPNSIFVRFDANVRPSLSRNDLRVVNMDTGDRVPISGVSWSAGKLQARFNIRTADLPAGKYRAVILAGDVKTPDGRALADDRAVEFVVERASPTPLGGTFGNRPIGSP